LQDSYAASLDVLAKVPDLVEMLKVGTAMYSTPNTNNVSLGDLVIMDGLHSATLLQVPEDSNYGNEIRCSLKI